MQFDNLYVVGGRQKQWARLKNEWHRHKKGVILRIDPKHGSWETCVEYVSPPDACAADEDPTILFKAGTVQDNKLYTCTGTEVLIYDLPSFDQIGYVSLPCFNDLHHVRPTPDGNLLIAVTGLDMVVETTLEGQVLREWDVLGQNPWERFSRSIDYRTVLTTKPHRSHPNYVFQVEDEVWVTRFEQKDAICLTKPNRRIDIGIERIHDGIVFEDRLYFTAVDGHVIIANIEDTQVEQIINLNEVVNTDHTLGWCRGLKVLDRDHLLVGFSRLRPTKFQENLRWVKHRVGLRETAGNLPARIALFNLKQRQVCWEFNLEEAGMSVVFSIHTLDE